MQVGQRQVHRLKVGLVEICPKSGGAAATRGGGKELRADGHLFRLVGSEGEGGSERLGPPLLSELLEATSLLFFQSAGPEALFALYLLEVATKLAGLAYLRLLRGLACVLLGVGCV